MAKKKAKKRVPNWQDSAYQRQISYYNKLLADYGAQETRKKAELGTYYGTLASPEHRKAGKWATKKKRGTGHWGKNKKGKKTWVKTYRSVPVTKKTWVPAKGKTKGHYVNKKVWQKGAVTQKAKGATEGIYQKELRESRSKDLVDIADDYAARGMIHSGLYAQKRGDYEKEFGKQLAESNRQKSKQYGDLAAERTQFSREQELQREQARLDAIRRRAAKTGSLGL